MWSKAPTFLSKTAGVVRLNNPAQMVKNEIVRRLRHVVF